MTKQEISEKVNAFLVEKLEIDKEQITPEAELKRDLGMTSLDAVETMLFIKRNFRFMPQNDDVKSFITLDDIYEYVLTHQKI